MQVKTLCLAALLLHGVIPSPLDAGQRQNLAAPGKLRGRFLHITDLHPDEFYKVHSSTEEADACHHGEGPAGIYGAETSDCDAPFSLINATFDWIAENLKGEIDFVIWTGDSARHDSDETVPRSPAQVLGTNRWIADKFADLFADPTGRGLSIPIVPTFGNNDILPHNILLPGPNKWLHYYTNIWRHFIPEEQRHSFDFGGWFYVEVIPNKLAVFSLNTLYFFDRNAGVDDCAHPSEPGFKQMDWLRIQLQFMRERGMKAILMGHVPPARTDSKMLWDETCWQKYTLWLKQYRDVVAGSLFGHMNIDHFLLQDTKEIDLALLSPMDDESQETVNVREAMEDELSIQSTADYLQELRDDWSKLPKPASDDDGKANKKKKHKKSSKKRWAERYQLTLISPSVVPNYFPTLRVFEYNISGMEDNPVWADAIRSAPPLPTGPHDQKVLELRDLPDFEGERKNHKSKAPNKVGEKKKKGNKEKKPKDPNLVIPDPPSKTSLPGPAYSPQPLTLTGYTQFYANLTHINNDMTSDDGKTRSFESWSDWLQRWREGKHGGKQPKSSKPNPRKFEYEVEYSTFNDKIYQLADLTVSSLAELAYRIGQNDPKDAGFFELDEDDGSDDELDDIDELDLDSDSDDEFKMDRKKKNGKKGKKKGNKKKGNKKRKNNKVWLHFLNHAFVSTVEKKDLKDMA